MSRVLAYLGPSIALSRLVLEPTYNLIAQARSPREMHHADLNSDGFGFGWYAADDSAAVYRRRSPIWHDHNLPDIARSLESQNLFVLLSVTGLVTQFGLQAVIHRHSGQRDFVVGSPVAAAIPRQ